MYGCNGKCCDRVIDPETGEGRYFICGGIDTCDETRVGEFIGTVGAVLFIVLAPIMLVTPEGEVVCADKVSSENAEGFGYISHFATCKARNR